MVPRDLTPDQLLSTTRAVRKRLDLTRPVERELLQECLGLPTRHGSSAALRGLRGLGQVGASLGISQHRAEPG
jgi:hypothetical protein